MNFLSLISGLPPSTLSFGFGFIRAKSECLQNRNRRCRVCTLYSFPMQIAFIGKRGVEYGMAFEARHWLLAIGYWLLANMCQAHKQCQQIAKAWWNKIKCIVFSEVKVCHNYFSFSCEGKNTALKGKIRDETTG